MKIIGTFLTLLGIFLLFMFVRGEVLSQYSWENKYNNLWELADKSSTISAKQKYIADYVAALKSGNEKGEFASHNAIWLKTPNNSFAANMQALETLSNRLAEISTMDATSFQYNTAIQQITQQEQGEAGNMIHVLYGCYLLNNFILNWAWIALTTFLVSIPLILIGGIVLLGSYCY